jgi:hypothetical protein
MELCIHEYGQAELDDTLDRVRFAVKQAKPNLEAGNMGFDGPGHPHGLVHRFEIESEEHARH